MMRLALVVSFASLAACKAPVGVNNLSVAPDSGPRCADLCGQIGMPLDSVVIMADNVGCVCRAAAPAPQPPDPTQAPGAAPPPAATPVTGAASAGGMAAIMIQRQKQRQSQHHQPRPHK